MRKCFGWVGLTSATALLAACGGGGGSPGTTQESYSISLVAAKTSLPLNVSGFPAGIGAEAPFTTTIYVSAKKGDNPIPGGEDGVFACNTSFGLDSGPLYYLDGDDAHEDDDGNPTAYRSITLGSNAGGNSFHFHAGNQAGTATITCSVEDPRDKRQVSASVEITVGGGAGSGKAASIQGIAAYPTLGTQGNLSNLRTSTAVQAFVWDETNQPVPNPAAPNLQVELWSGAVNGARLLSGTQSGSTLQARAVGGVAQFALSSGPTAGAMVLRLTADRADNDVSNGIQDAIRHFVVVSAVDRVSTTPPTVAATTLTAQNAQAFAAALTASGGTPSYTWRLIEGSLPSGLSFSSSGLISGFTLSPPGSYLIRVEVTDQDGASATSTVTINVTGAIPTVPPVTFGGASITTKVNVPFSYALTADGGTPPYNWQTLPAGTAMPAGLTLNSGGVISGNPNTAGTYTIAIQVSGGSSSANGNLTLTIEP